MRQTDLPSLRGLITVGAQLRILVAKAINEAQVYARNMGASGAAVQARIDALNTFFNAALAEIAVLEDKPVSIAITPDPVSVAELATQQLTVTATTVVGATPDVTATSTYDSSDDLIATVDAAGLVTGVAAGSCVVTATYLGKVDTVAVTVTA